MPSLRCTVVDAGRPAAPVDLEVSAPMGTPWSAVCGQVLAAADVRGDAPVQVGGQPLAPDAELGQPPLLDGALLLAGATASGRSPRGMLELHVTHGPDCGRVHPLRPGQHLIGRAPGCDLTLDDPQASRRHAVLHVGPDGLRLHDLGSANGTRLDGRPVTSTGSSVAVTVGQRLRLGASTLVVRPPAVRRATCRVTGEGTVEVNCPPRPAPAAHQVRLRRPTAVAAPTRHRWPLAAMLVPLLVAVPIALLLRQPAFLLFALMTPVMMVASAVSDRSRGRRDHRDAVSRHDQRDADVDARLAQALVAELAARRAAAPDAAELLRAVTRPSARLWERPAAADDALALLVGTGRVAADVTVTDADGVEQPAFLADAPVVVPLTGCGHLGLHGPPETVAGVTRHLLCQLAAWHSPRTLQLIVLCGNDSHATSWRWTRWLPHVAGDVVHEPKQVQDVVARLVEQVAERAEQRHDASAWCGPRTVLVLAGASRLRGVPGMAELMSRGPAVGIHAICLADRRAGLPGECGATLSVSETDHAEPGALLQQDGQPEQRLQWDAVRAGWADRVARALAPLRDATPDGGTVLPSAVRLLDLLACDATDPADVLRQWREQPSSTCAPVGVDAEGVATLDLRTDGPHALVAGTTGAGKSELLRTLVAALAVGNRPDELSMVLVDYKGGAAFAACAGLPHVSGVVTDLDAALAERALQSLGAELTRRERLLADAGADDLDAYDRRRRHDPTMPAIARLVVVIDEFRVLAEELPSFVTGLVRVAAVGRSLGVHLVLATQRPAGIVSADIKANVNLRIALRLRDRSDSDDVIEAPDAARLDPAAPGRAVWRSGSGGLRTVQIARVSGTSDADGPGVVSVRVAGAASAGDIPTSVPEAHGSDDLAAVVEAVRRAAAESGLQAAPAAWLPPLPEVVTDADLRRVAAADGVPSSTGAEVALGLVDLPALQRQPVLAWRPGFDGHLGVHGPARSGRTTALLGVAARLSQLASPDELQLHVVDAAGGGLRGLASLPHCGTALTRDQPRLVARLVERLTEQVRARALALTPSPQPVPQVVLLIDGWDALVEGLDELDHGRSSDALLSLLRDGQSAGLGAVVAGGRALLASRLTAVLGERLLLRVNDPTDLLLAGVASSSASPSAPPGRGVRVSDGSAVQLAVVGQADVPQAVAAVVAAARARWAGRPGDVAPGTPSTVAHDRVRVAELPTTASLDQLVRRRDRGSLAELSVLVGVGGDDATPVGLDLHRDPAVVVAGEAGTGRSTTLLSMARALHAGGAEVLGICPRHSVLGDGPWPALRPDDPTLAARLRSGPGCVLVDDADLLSGSPVDALLDELVRRRSTTAVVLAGTPSALVGSYRGVVASVRAARTGLLLSPTGSADGEVLGVRVQPPDRLVPGRGVLVVRGRQTPVQVAC